MDVQRPTVKIPQHKHCLACGRAIKVKDETCSAECKAEWDKTVKRKRFWLLVYGAMAVVLVMLSLTLGRG